MWIPYLSFSLCFSGERNTKVLVPTSLVPGGVFGSRYRGTVEEIPQVWKGRKDPPKKVMFEGKSDG